MLSSPGDEDVSALHRAPASHSVTPTGNGSFLFLYFVPKLFSRGVSPDLLQVSFISLGSRLSKTDKETGRGRGEGKAKLVLGC